LGTLFFQGIHIFPRKNELISLGKMKIHWKNRVSKQALKEDDVGCIVGEGGL
jgi:hypothetical protein